MCVCVSLHTVWQTRLLVVTTSLSLTLQDGQARTEQFNATTGMTNMDTGAFGAMQVCKACYAEAAMLVVQDQ